jgi:hypothetical protein
VSSASAGEVGGHERNGEAWDDHRDQYFEPVDLNQR